MIFYTDDQGTLDANCFGSSDLMTPNIDSLATSGVRLTQHYAHTVCCPSRAALLTGRHPQRSNVNSWTQGRTWDRVKGRNMALAETTLAELLRDSGYKTALFGKWHLGAHPDHGPKKQGFDTFFGFRAGFIDNYHHFGGHGVGAHDLFEGVNEVFHRGEYFPDLIVDRAISFIERNQAESFFLHIPFNLPHYPEQAVGQHAEEYAELPEPRRSYARVVSTCDHYLGRVLTALDRFGVRDNTIVIFTADNGHSEEDYQITVDGHLAGMQKGQNYGANGGGGNTGKWIGAKGSFLEGGIRVPAVISFPKELPTGETRSQAVTIMDWLPTITELCNVPLPDDLRLDGKSLLPLLKDDQQSSPYSNESGPELHWQWQKGWAVRQGDWKLIFKGSKGLGQPKLDPWTLTSLEDTQPESVNHYESHPEIAARLKAIHDSWAEDVFSTYPPQ
ncbi:MAG: sulfatase-like hydrolase/transferase [Planctomycetota bacterium]